MDTVNSPDLAVGGPDGVGGTRHHFINTLPIALITFASIMFMVGIGDAIMSYTVPVYMENALNSSLLMGLILSTSSMAGIASDIFIGQRFADKKFAFFLWWMFVAAIIFPLSLLLLPPIVPVFIMGMAIWGIYYELIQFGNFHFIHAFVDREQHAFAWGTLAAFKSLAYTIGPILASLLIDRNLHLPFAASIVFYLVAILGLTFFLKAHRPKHHAVSSIVHEPTKRSFLQEMRLWRTLFRRLWLLFMFSFTLGLVDATFWSVGTVLSEQLSNPNEHGLLLVAYSIPTFFVGFMAGKVARPFGKKRAAFITATFSGMVLVVAGMVQSNDMLLILVFISSVFSSISWPEMNAVYEDYVARLGKTGNDLIGLQSSSVGLAYIIGPTIAGLLASIIGNQMTFSIVGGLLIVISIISLIVVPRKIKLPEKELKQLIS